MTEYSSPDRKKTIHFAVACLQHGVVQLYLTWKLTTTLGRAAGGNVNTRKSPAQTWRTLKMIDIKRQSSTNQNADNNALNRTLAINTEQVNTADYKIQNNSGRPFNDPFKLKCNVCYFRCLRCVFQLNVNSLERILYFSFRTKYKHFFQKLTHITSSTLLP